MIRADPAAAAFFDLDNTVIQGASLFQLAKGLYRRGFFPTRVIMRGLWLQAYFRFVGRENPGHIEDARSATLSFISGHTVAEVTEIGHEVYEESISQRIWPGTRAIAQMHLDVGQQVWLVTAAPIEVAGIIAARLGLTGALGTTAEHVDGVYTGRLKGDLLHGPAKAEAVRALAERARLRPGPLLRLLRLVQRPADAVAGRPPLRDQPRPPAAAYAEEQDWQIRDYRTGRRAAQLGLLGAGAAGAAAGSRGDRAGRTPPPDGSAESGVQERRDMTNRTTAAEPQIERRSRRSRAPPGASARPLGPATRPTMITATASSASAAAPTYTKPLSCSTSKRTSVSAAGRRIRMTSTLKPAKASKINASAQNTQSG